MSKAIDKVKNNKTLLIILALVIGLLLVLVARIAYAFFQAKSDTPKSVNVTAQSDTVDEFKFTSGSPLSLSATAATLPENGANLTSTSTPKVTLKANSSSNSASKTYYVYFQITSNNFAYTNSTNPEILLSITSPSGAVTSLDGLTYHTINGVSGFDVTTKTGLITVASGYSISSSSSTTATTHNWTFTLTYLNRDYDQSANYGHTMNVKAILSKNVYVEPKYWNASFDDTFYSFPNVPTSNYNSIELLSDNSEYFASYPVFIKTTSTEHQACLYYNNHEFCLAPNYWETDGATTKSKLQSAMESSLGISASSCTSTNTNALCVFGSFNCEALYNGEVKCDSPYPYCYINSSGSGKCRYPGPE